jgi:hypothetical protein
MWESFALNGWCFKRLFHLSFKKSLFSLSFLSTFGPSLFDLREREREREREGGREISGGVRENDMQKLRHL